MKSNNKDAIFNLCELLKKNDSADAILESITEEVKTAISADVISKSPHLFELVYTVARYVKNDALFDELTDILDAVFELNPKLLFEQRIDGDKDSALSCAVRNSNFQMAEYVLHKFVKRDERPKKAFESFFAPTLANAEDTSIYDLAKKIDGRKSKSKNKNASQDSMLGLLYSHGVILFAKGALLRDETTRNQFLISEHKALYPQSKTQSPFVNAGVFNNILNPGASSSSSRSILIINKDYWTAFLTELKTHEAVPRNSCEALLGAMATSFTTHKVSHEAVQRWVIAQLDILDALAAQSEGKASNLVRSFNNWLLTIEESAFRNALIALGLTSAPSLYGIFELFVYKANVEQQINNAKKDLHDTYACEGFQACLPAYSNFKKDCNDTSPDLEEDYRHCSGLVDHLIGVEAGAAFSIIGTFFLTLAMLFPEVSKVVAWPVNRFFRFPLEKLAVYLGEYTPEKNIANKEQLLATLRDLLNEFTRVTTPQNNNNNNVNKTATSSATLRLLDINVSDRDINQKDLSLALAALEILIKRYDALKDKPVLNLKAQTVQHIQSIAPADVNIELGGANLPGRGMRFQWGGGNGTITVTEQIRQNTSYGTIQDGNDGASAKSSSGCCL